MCLAKRKKQVHLCFSPENWLDNNRDQIHTKGQISFWQNSWPTKGSFEWRHKKFHRVTRKCHACNITRAFCDFPVYICKIGTSSLAFCIFVAIHWQWQVVCLSLIKISQIFVFSTFCVIKGQFLVKGGPSWWCCYKWKVTKLGWQGNIPPAKIPTLDDNSFRQNSIWEFGVRRMHTTLTDKNKLKRQQNDVQGARRRQSFSLSIKTLSAAFRVFEIFIHLLAGVRGRPGVQITFSSPALRWGRLCH